MPLAAMFTIAMLAWYAWHESDSKKYLALFYIFLGLAMLAKGPVAPFLAVVIIVIFAAANRDYRSVRANSVDPGNRFILRSSFALVYRGAAKESGILSGVYS